MQCKQCGNNAIVILGGHPLCIDCFYKFKKIQQMEDRNYMQEMNHIMDMAEFTVGMPGILPRYNIQPQQPIHINKPFNFNNINISNSVVGALNLGEAKKIDVSIEMFKNSDNNEIIEPLKEFTEAVINEQKLNKELKNEILEQLSFLSSQANLSDNQKVKRSIVKPVFLRIKEAINLVPALLGLWEKLQPLFEKLF